MQTMHSTGNRTRELLSIAALIIGPAWIALHWSALPSSIPIHFGLLGTPNGWAPKEAIFLMPFASIWMYVIMTAARFFKQDPNVPWKITEANRERTRAMAYSLVSNLKLFILCAFSYIQYTQVQVALQQSSGLGVWFAPIFLLTIFGLIAHFMFTGKQQFS